MSLIAVMGRFEFAAQHIEAATRAAAAMARETRRESGCIAYTFGTDIEQPDCLILSEIWRDAAALEAHFATAHMAAFRACLREMNIIRMNAVRLAVADMHDMLAGGPPGPGRVP